MSTRDTNLYRRDAAASGSLLTAKEREELVRKYLPAPEDTGIAPKGGAAAGDSTTTNPTIAASTTSTKNGGSGHSRKSSRQQQQHQQHLKTRRKPIRAFVKAQIHFLIYALMQLFFGLYIRIRRVWRGAKSLTLRVLYHHHRTPELIESDVAGLSRLPKHLSVLLELSSDGAAVDDAEHPGGILSTSARRAMRRRMQKRQKQRNQQKRRSLRKRREEQLQRRQQQLQDSHGEEPSSLQLDGYDHGMEDETEEEDGITGLGLDIELEAMLDDVAELAAWSAAAGIPVLSIYERRGVLKEMIPGVHAAVRARLVAYFGKRRCPTLQVRAPHVPSYLNGDDDDEEAGDDSEGPGRRGSRSPTRKSGAAAAYSSPKRGVNVENHSEYDSGSGSGSNTGNLPSDGDGSARRHLDLLLLSEDDGRATMVDLTKTLTDMGQRGRLSARDIGVELLEQELSDSYSAPDPDLLILFGDRVVLRGYPPWQLRLTEMFCSGETGSGAVDYPSWLRGLYSFAKAEMRFGR